MRASPDPSVRRLSNTNCHRAFRWGKGHSPAKHQVAQHTTAPVLRWRMRCQQRIASVLAQYAAAPILTLQLAWSTASGEQRSTRAPLLPIKECVPASHWAAQPRSSLGRARCQQPVVLGSRAGLTNRGHRQAATACSLSMAISRIVWRSAVGTDGTGQRPLSSGNWRFNLLLESVKSTPCSSVLAAD